LDIRHRKKTQTPPKKIDTGNIGHKTQKDRHGPHQKRYTRVALDIRHRKKTRTPPKRIDTGNIGHKRQKDKHRYHYTQDTERRHEPHQKRYTRVSLGIRHSKKTHTPPKKIDTGNIGHKKQKEKTDPTRKDKHG
jgi:hypothetical protein